MTAPGITLKELMLVIAQTLQGPYWSEFQEPRHTASGNDPSIGSAVISIGFEKSKLGGWLSQGSTEPLTNECWIASGCWLAGGWTSISSCDDTRFFRCSIAVAPVGSLLPNSRFDNSVRWGSSWLSGAFAILVEMMFPKAPKLKSLRTVEGSKYLFSICETSASRIASSTYSANLLENAAAVVWTSDITDLIDEKFWRKRIISIHNIKINNIFCVIHPFLTKKRNSPSFKL